MRCSLGSMLAIVCLLGGSLAALSGCTAPADGDAGPAEDRFGGTCADDDPLTYLDWGGFCDDRVDDNCTFDVDPIEDGCNIGNTNQPNPCNTGDEPCPATLPASAAPVWDCQGDAPEGVIAVARFGEAAGEEGNEQVASFCSFIYESAAVEGEFYVTIDFVNGPDTRGPDGKCSADFAARRHFFLSDLDGTTGGECGPVEITHPAPIDEQPLSNGCRKAMRNLFQAQANFDPDVQFFARSREEALEKLAVLETAEIACIGINDTMGEPYRPNEVWASQASAPMVLVE